MKRLSLSDVDKECEGIWKQFLGPGAEMLVNVDSKTRKITEENMKRPDRWTFDDAAAHLYYLMTRYACMYLLSIEYSWCMLPALIIHDNF